VPIIDRHATNFGDWHWRKTGGESSKQRNAKLMLRRPKNLKIRSFSITLYNTNLLHRLCSMPFHQVPNIKW